jgi:hypothetical protein
MGGVVISVTAKLKWIIVRIYWGFVNIVMNEDDNEM